jgi:hypothetical protein
MSTFRFVSSYRGESDYRHTATGARWRVNHADPARLYDQFPERPAPAELLAEWHAFRITQARDLARWADGRGIPADLRAHFPDVTDAEISAEQVTA